MSMSTKSERFIAAILDYIFLTVIQVIPLMFLTRDLNLQEIIDWLLDTAATTPPQALINLTIGSTITALIVGFFLYVIVPTIRNGQTLGKMIMKIKVVDEEGKNPTFIQHFIRSIMMWSNYLTFPTIFFISTHYFLVSSLNNLVGIASFIVIVISIIMIVTKEEEQGIHDKLVNTKVIFKATELNNTDALQEPPINKEEDWLNDFDDDSPWNK